MSGGKKVETDQKKLPIVIFSDDKRYWSVFKPVCRELDKRGVDVVYMTASEDDPALSNEFPHIRAEFISSGNKAYAKLNFLNASIVLSSTPGLDVYQWKRSHQVDWYVHMLHAASDVIGYKSFGIDYYDALLLSGQYQVDDVRALEELRHLPAKELVKIGIPYMDDMAARLAADGKRASPCAHYPAGPLLGRECYFQKVRRQNHRCSAGYRLSHCDPPSPTVLHGGKKK